MTYCSTSNNRPFFHIKNMHSHHYYACGNKNHEYSDIGHKIFAWDFNKRSIFSLKDDLRRRLRREIVNEAMVHDRRQSWPRWKRTSADRLFQQEWKMVLFDLRAFFRKETHTSEFQWKELLVSHSSYLFNISNETVSQPVFVTSFVSASVFWYHNSS